MSTHTFRMATIEDKADLLAFLKTYWNEKHIYVTYEPLFDYDIIHNDELHFLLAHNEAGEIDGILGFIPYSPVLQGADTFNVLWKVKPKNGDPMLGLELLQRMVNNYGFRRVSTVGANTKTLPLYEYLGYHYGPLEHYYILHPTLQHFEIAANVPEQRNIAVPTGDNHLVELHNFAELSAAIDLEQYKDKPPYKSPWYVEKRYFKHPVYQYKVYGIQLPDGKMRSVFFTREVSVNNARVLRIVDFIGHEEDIVYSGTGFYQLLEQHGFEYVDFYLYGISQKTMSDAGFSLKQHEGELIIPNYFEPFVQQNIVINFFTVTKDPIFIFRGDGDQDRPNQIS